MGWERAYRIAQMIRRPAGARHSHRSPIFYRIFKVPYFFLCWWAEYDDKVYTRGVPG